MPLTPVYRIFMPLLVVLLSATKTLVACNVDDTGNLCTSPNSITVAQPIAGEVTLNEVVNITRDPNCLQFSCLTGQGLPSYCTHTCRYNQAPKKPITCKLDADCTLPQHCHEGICNDDNCPPGFFCENPEASGSLAATAYCMRQTNCRTHADCGDVGVVACVTVGCYDSCLNTANACLLHQLTCAPLSSLNCTCATPTAVCPDAALTCKPAGAPTSFAPGSVTQKGFCLPKQ